MASKTLTWQHLLGVLVPRVCTIKKNLSTILTETQTFLKRTNFSFQTHTNSTIYIFVMCFYLVLSRRVCTRSSQGDGHSVKRPFPQQQPVDSDTFDYFCYSLRFNVLPGSGNILNTSEIDYNQQLQAVP